MSERKGINTSKLVTVCYLALLGILLGASVLYLLAGKDFVQPISFTIDGSSYGYTLDEFAEYLKEQDYITEDSYETLDQKEPGIEEIRKYGDVLVLKYDNAVMNKDDANYATWQKSANVGNAFLSDGTSIIQYGIFGASYVAPEKGSEEKYLCMNGFPTEYSGMHGGITAWDCTMDDLIAYFIDCGFFKEEDINDMSEVGTINKIANNIDMIWWDVENLEEGTDAYDYWNQMANDGYIFLYGQAIYVPVMNGPFGISVNSSSSVRAEDVYEAFAKFPQ